MEKVAVRGDWKIFSLPAEHDVLVIDRQYTSEEFCRISVGCIPKGMDDHWFIFYEDPWLYLHRSWTGLCIFQVRFESVNQGHRVVEVLVNAELKQWNRCDERRNALLATILLDQCAERDITVLWQEYASLL